MAAAADFTITAPAGTTIALDSGQHYAAAGSSSNITFTATANSGFVITGSPTVSVVVAIPATK